MGIHLIHTDSVRGSKVGPLRIKGLPTELQYENQVKFFHDNPEVDVRGQQKYIFLNLLDAGQGMRDRRNTAAELCVLPGATNNNKRTKLADVTDPAEKRFV